MSPSSPPSLNTKSCIWPRGSSLVTFYQNRLKDFSRLYWGLNFGPSPNGKRGCIIPKKVDGISQSKAPQTFSNAVIWHCRRMEKIRAEQAPQVLVVDHDDAISISSSEEMLTDDEDDQFRQDFSPLDSSKDDELSLGNVSKEDELSLGNVSKDDYALSLIYGNISCPGLKGPPVGILCFYHTSLRFIIPSQQRWRGYSNAAVRRWLGEWVSGFVSAWVRPTLPCGHDSDSHYSFCPNTFKLHMHIDHDERRNPIGFGSRGQRSRSTLALCV